MDINNGVPMIGGNVIKIDGDNIVIDDDDEELCWNTWFMVSDH